MTFLSILCLIVVTLFVIGLGCYGLERGEENTKPLPFKHYWWFAPLVGVVVCRWIYLLTPLWYINA